MNIATLTSNFKGYSRISEKHETDWNEEVQGEKNDVIYEFSFQNGIRWFLAWIVVEWLDPGQLY